MNQLSFLTTKLAAIEINCGIGVAGFALCLVWRRAVGSMLEQHTVALLATVWIALIACGLALAIFL
jgi:hypothetical protein